MGISGGEHGPGKINKMMQALDFKILPFLGMSPHITKEWQMLPEMFLGIGLPNFVVNYLCQKVVFLQCH